MTCSSAIKIVGKSHDFAAAAITDPVAAAAAFRLRDNLLCVIDSSRLSIASVTICLMVFSAEYRCLSKSAWRASINLCALTDNRAISSLYPSGNLLWSVLLLFRDPQNPDRTNDGGDTLAFGRGSILCRLHCKGIKARTVSIWFAPFDSWIVLGNFYRRTRYHDIILNSTIPDQHLQRWSMKDGEEQETHFSYSVALL